MGSTLKENVKLWSSLKKRVSVENMKIKLNKNKLGFVSLLCVKWKKLGGEVLVLLTSCSSFSYGRSGSILGIIGEVSSGYNMLYQYDFDQNF